MSHKPLTIGFPFSPKAIEVGSTFGRGACTYDIRTGGRGVPQELTRVLIICVSVTVTMGGGILRTSLVNVPKEERAHAFLSIKCRAFKSRGRGLPPAPLAPMPRIRIGLDIFSDIG